MISALKIITKAIGSRILINYSTIEIRPAFVTAIYKSSRTMSSVPGQQDILKLPQSSPPHGEDSLGNIVYVQHNPNSDMMTISFEFKSNSKSKQFNLYRKASDPLSSSLERIRLNVVKMMQKNKKVKKAESQDDLKDEEDLKLEFIVNGSTIKTDSLRNAEAWVEGAVFEVNGKPYHIRWNEPQVLLMKLPSPMMKSFVLLPNVSLSNCQFDNCIFKWYRKISADEKDKLRKSNEAGDPEIHFQDNSHWLKVGDSLTYSPVEEDVAHFLKVVCYPSNGKRWGLPYSCLSSRPVELGPSNCPFEKRHRFTEEKLSSNEKFRFVSYNILADLYADSDYSRSVLFAHCPAHALEIDYRRQLLLKEIHGYNADIVCLQEVDKREFNRTYEPFFQMVSGHSGVFSAKGGQVGEGVATFYRRDKFKLIETHKTILSKLIDPHVAVVSDGLDEIADGDVVAKKEDAAAEDKQDPNDSDSHPILKDVNSPEAQRLLSQFDTIRTKILAKETLKKRFLNRHTVLQTSLLQFQDLPNTFVIVANTHLYFAPDADHIRLLQGAICVKYIEYIRAHYKALLQTDTNSNNCKHDEPKMSLVFCGDMNSTPDCGLFRLVQTGHVGSNLPDWSSNKDESVEGLELETHLRFKSAYENIPYTNYTPGFNGCLDYIYYGVDNLACDSIVNLPEHEDVIATAGIPSDVFPSDHLALIANLRFLNK